MSGFSSNDGNADLLRYDWRLEQSMLGIAEHELKRMRAGRQFEPHFGLAGAEVQVVLVLRDRLVWVERRIDIDQQMMMSGVLRRIAGSRNPHVAQPEAAPEAAFDALSLVRPDDIQIGVMGRWCLGQCGDRDRHCG